MLLPHLISPLAIAPMIDWTYMHFRVFMRILAPHVLLYTEMQTIGAIRHQPERALAFDAIELPALALQVGGADPVALAEVAQQAEAMGYAEINLNLGCPSDKVQAGRFGACLMREPDLVAACIAEMKQAVSIPVTAKTRIGIEKQDDYVSFAAFVERLIDAGCDKLIVHARKAWLNGLNPKQNRTIPPIQYDYVYRIKHQLLEIPVVINGHIQTVEAMFDHLEHVDGVMVGRLACHDPYAIGRMHHSLYPSTPLMTRAEALRSYIAYLQSKSLNHTSTALILKPIFNLAHALPGARAWKAKLMSMKQSDDFLLLLDAAEILAEMEERFSC